MKSPNFFKEIERESVWGKSETPIWMASSFLFQRNLLSAPFPNKMTRAESKQTLDSLKKSLLNSSYNERLQFFSHNEINALEQEFILEHFLTSANGHHPECEGGVVIDQGGDFLAMINGEDHLVLQTLQPHAKWNEGWKKLCDVEKQLSKKHPFAYTPQFGYLTSHLSNAGTALTAQVFLHLPALIQLDQLSEVLMKELGEEVMANGLTGTQEFVGDIVILQNRFTLGLTEDHILETLHKTATTLMTYEKKLRTVLIETRDALIVDKISRAIGLLKHSYQIETKEALDALSFIKLGIDLKWITGLSDHDLNRLFFTIRRAHLSLYYGEEISKEMLAQKRAEYLQSVLKPIEIKR